VKGELDGAVVGALYGTPAQQRGLTLYKYIDEITGNFVCCRIIVPVDYAKANRDQYIGFLAAHIRAYKVFITDPERTIAIGRKYLPDVEEAVLRRELYENGHLGLHPDPESDRIRDYYQALIDIGYCQGPLERIKPFIDTSFYEEALNRVISQYPEDPFYQRMKIYFKEINDGILNNETSA
jgi:NitT/TauT family transport system substrate-binding protein